MTYSVIYCDPPWDYAGQTQHTDGDFKEGMSAKDHYNTMTLKQLKALDVKSLADASGCLLFMWSSSPHLPQALELMKAWGFDYKTIAFVWEKQKTNPGYYTLSQVEICIVGKRGIIPKNRGSRKERQFLSEMRGRHSAKPAEIRKRITRMFPQHKKVELFARESTEGWAVWGNEVQNTAVVPVATKSEQSGS
jgi:N6-adenosine-specific RNA methylase IME4